MGVLQQPSAVAFLHQGIGGAHGAGPQPHGAIDDRHRRQLAAGEHEITERYLFIREAADALIEAFVVAAEQHQLLVVGGPAA